MGDLTKFMGGQVALKDPKKMAQALKQSSDEGAIGQLPDGGVYISFSGKMNRYSIGQDKKDADPDNIWLVNIYAIEKGWMCWKSGSPLAKRMASIYADPVPTPDFNEHGPFNEKSGDGWYRAKALMLRCIDDGVQGYFSTNSKSGVGEFSKLEDEIGRRLEEGEPCWPVIHLEREEFTAQGQKNGKPVLKVYGWLRDTQIEKMAGMDDIQEIADSIDDLLVEAEEETVAPDTASYYVGNDDDGPDEDLGDDDVEDADIEEDDDETEPAPEPAVKKARRRRRAAV